MNKIKKILLNNEYINSEKLLPEIPEKYNKNLHYYEV